MKKSGGYLVLNGKIQEERMCVHWGKPHLWKTQKKRGQLSLGLIFPPGDDEVLRKLKTASEKSS